MDSTNTNTNTANTTNTTNTTNTANTNNTTNDLCNYPLNQNSKKTCKELLDFHHSDIPNLDRFNQSINMCANKNINNICNLLTIKGSQQNCDASCSRKSCNDFPDVKDLVQKCSGCPEIQMDDSIDDESMDNSMQASNQNNINNNTCYYGHPHYMMKIAKHLNNLNNTNNN